MAIFKSINDFDNIARIAKEILERFSGKCYVEAKYDGYRMQLHIDTEVSLWSRNQESYTEQFPDVAQAVKNKLIKKRSKLFILNRDLFNICNALKGLINRSYCMQSIGF